MQKQLTTGMQDLDIYFVKYMESRIAAYRAAFEGAEPSSAAMVVDRYLSKQPDASPEAIAKDLRARIDALAPAPTEKEAEPPAIPMEETIRAVPPVFQEQKTVTMTPSVKKTVPPQPEPPAIDLRTGIITVSDDVKEEKPVKEAIAPKPVQKPAAVKPAIPEKKPQPQAPVQKPQIQVPPAPPAIDEDAFDLDFAPKAVQKKPVQLERSLDTKAMQADHGEKTLQWDRNQLMGAAAMPPEAIVVEGAEVARRPEAPKPQQPAPAGPLSAGKQDDPMVSGEDIANTMDSFFGLDEK